MIPPAMKRAVVVIGHGSKLAGSDDAMGRTVDSLRRKEPDTLVQIAFLEIQSPTIQEAIELVLRHGAEEVVLVPYFVQTGRHVTQDIPKIASEAQAKYPKKKFRLARYLGFDERIVSVVRDRIREARTYKQPGNS